jgi:hypothetical protein
VGVSAPTWGYLLGYGSFSDRLLEKSLGKRGTKKYKDKKWAVLCVQRIFVGKMCPNGHIVWKKK